MMREETFFDYEISLSLLVDISLLNLEVVEHVIFQTWFADTLIVQLLPKVVVVPSDVSLKRENLAVIYVTTPQNISLHVGNIYQDKELSEKGTRKKFFLVR